MLIRSVISLIVFLLGIDFFAFGDNFYPILYENNLYLGFPENNFEKPISPCKIKPEKQDYFKIYLLSDSTVIVQCKNGRYLQQKDSFIFSSALNIQEASRFIFKKKYFNSFLVYNNLGLPIGFDNLNGKTLIFKNTNSKCLNTFYIISNNVITYTDKYFSSLEIIILVIGFLFFLLSLISFIFYKNYFFSILFLLIGGFLLRFFISILYPSLFLWDEQFHALVAKNMINHPFKPVLYKNPLLPYDPNSWVSNHVWLHKYPVFLWLMSISISIFGAEAWAVRLPSAILMTITSYFIFGIASFLYNNKKIGYWAAFLFSVSHFTYLLSSGYLATDHNDVAFIFCITASVWSYFQYLNNKKLHWIFLIGLFSGLAILNKWLLGVFVYLFWIFHYFVSFLIKEKYVFKLKHLLLSLGITLLIAGFWHVYIMLKYYELAIYELQFSLKHFSEAIEGHNRPFNWHFKNIYFIYGIDFFLLLPIVVIGTLNFSKISLKISSIITIFAVYIFFNFSKTKMIVFPYPFTVFFIFSCVAFVFHVLLNAIIDLFNNKKVSAFISLYFVILIGVYSFNIEKIHYEFKLWKKDDYEYNTRAFKTFKFINLLGDFINSNKEKSWIIFNAHPVYFDNIKFMFFTDVVAAYNYIPEFDELNNLINLNYSIIILDHENVPLNYKNLKNTYLIKGYWEVFR